MLPLLALAAIGAMAGAGKAFGPDADKETRTKNIAATTARYSPWTGMKAGEIQYADPMGSIVQGGTMGAMLGQSLNSAAAADEANQAYAARMRAPASGSDFGLQNTWANMQNPSLLTPAERMNMYNNWPGSGSGGFSLK